LTREHESIHGEASDTNHLIALFVSFRSLTPDPVLASEMATMTPPLTSRRRSKIPPLGETGREALYLKSLSERKVPVSAKLRPAPSRRSPSH
jgi:hypothetical protein